MRTALERDARDVPEDGKQLFIAGEPVFRWEMPDELVDLVERRLAPFHPERELRFGHELQVHHNRSPAESAQYPFADVSQLRNRPKRNLHIQR